MKKTTLFAVIIALTASFSVNAGALSRIFDSGVSSLKFNGTKIIPTPNAMVCYLPFLPQPTTEHWIESYSNITTQEADIIKSNFLPSHPDWFCEEGFIAIDTTAEIEAAKQIGINTSLRAAPNYVVCHKKLEHEFVKSMLMHMKYSSPEEAQEASKKFNKNADMKCVAGFKPE
jgi:hypothetical protein